MRTEFSQFEELFPVKPMGVKYICEHCSEGEMIVESRVPINHMDPPMFPHRCNKCNKSLLLPRVYPYIEWLEGEMIDDAD